MENMKKIKPKADYLFEVSFEVCNKIGGIYTVITSKADLLFKYYNNKYFLIGPYIPGEGTIRFREKESPYKFKDVFAELKKEGIECHYGEWRIGEKDINTILIDYRRLVKYDKIKKEIQKEFNISSAKWNASEKEIGHYRVVDLTWAIAVAKLLTKIWEKEKNKKIVAQFHDWLPGYAIKFLKGTGVATVFTTHATRLARALTTKYKDIYKVLDKINYDKESKSMGVFVECLCEKIAAKSADIFTAVSETTALEAKKLLGRNPDVLTLNGLDFRKFPSLEERLIKHNLNNQKIKEFLLYYFFPYYHFNIKNTLIYFICGRYEFKNKGIDILIESLGKLNNILKKDDFKKTIVVFFWIPTNVIDIKKSLIESRIFYGGIKNFVHENLETIRDKIIYSIVSRRRLSKLITSDFLFEIRKRMMGFIKKGLPPPVTHNLINKRDIILMNFKKVGLNNSAEDKVKVIYYPVYLTGADGLLDLSYYDAMIGCDLGIFPSYYEPWGYTPLESGALSVPAVTTDLAGFGKFLLKNATEENKKGIFVLRRKGKKDKEVINSLVKYLYSFAKLPKKPRTERKLKARSLALLANWEKLIIHHIHAHNLALEKIKTRKNS